MALPTFKATGTGSAMAPAWPTGPYVRYVAPFVCVIDMGPGTFVGAKLLVEDENGDYPPYFGPIQQLFS